MTLEEIVKAACLCICLRGAEAPRATPSLSAPRAVDVLSIHTFAYTEEAILCLRENIKGVITNT